jgi:hypothetical protein
LKEGLCKGGGADRLAEEAETTFDLRGGAIEEIQSFLEVGKVRGREGGVGIEMFG